MSDAPGDQSRAVAYGRIAARCKIAFFVLLFVNLFLGTYYPAQLESPGMQLLVALMVGALALVWTRVDGAMRQRTLPTPLAVGIVMLAAVFVPVWLFVSREPPVAVRSLVRFVLWLLALIVGFSMGASVLEQVGIARVAPASP